MGWELTIIGAVMSGCFYFVFDGVASLSKNLAEHRRLLFEISNQLSYLKSGLDPLINRERDAEAARVLKAFRGESDSDG